MAMWLARTAALIAFLIFAVWAFRDPKFDSIGGAFVALTALLGLFIVPKLKSTQQQKLSGGAIGMQAGGNLSVGNVSAHSSENDEQ